MDSALESWDSSGQEGNKASNNARLQDEHQFDGSSNSSNPSNNTDSAIRSESNDIHSTTNVNKWAEGGPWDFLSANSHSGSMPPSCCSSGGVDEWSRRIDDLDHLRPLEFDNVRDSFSDLPDITEITELSEVCHDEMTHNSASYTAVNEMKTQRCNDIDDICSHEIDDCVSDITTADIHLKEVEEQLQNIFTPTPIELMKVTLVKSSDIEDFGFSVCDGVFEKGVYVGAIRRNGPAADALKPFDRVLQVNLTPTKDLECFQVVPLIGQSGNQVDLVISRNPLVWGLEPSQHPYRSINSQGDYSCRMQGSSGEGEAARRRDTLPKQTQKTDIHKKSVTSLHDGNRGIAR